MSQNPAGASGPGDETAFYEILAMTDLYNRFVEILEQHKRLAYVLLFPHPTSAYISTDMFSEASFLSLTLFLLFLSFSFSFSFTSLFIHPGAMDVFAVMQQCLR